MPLATAEATAKTSALNDTRSALTRAAASSPLTAGLGLTRETALAKARAKPLLAALLAHRTGNAGEVGVGRGRLPVVILAIDFRRPGRRNQRKVRRRLRFEFVVFVVVVKETVGIIGTRRLVGHARARGGSRHLFVARLAIWILVVDLGLTRRSPLPTRFERVGLSGHRRACASGRRLGIAPDLLEHGRERGDITGIEFDPPAADQSGRQTDRTKADPNQSRDDQSHCLKNTTHLAVAPLADHDAVPVIGAITADILERQEVRRTIFQRDSCQQLFAGLVVDSAKDTDRVFAFPSKAGMHQQVGQFTRRGKHQQTFGIEVEPPHGHPALTLEPGQALEDGGALTGIVAAADFTRRLVIKQDFRGRFLYTPVQRPAVDTHLIGRPDTLTDISRLAVDRHPSGDDELLHFAPRSDTGISQQLVQLGRILIGFARRRATRGIAPARIGRIDADLGLARIDRDKLIGITRAGGTCTALACRRFVLGGARPARPARPLSVAARPPAVHAVSGPLRPATIVLAGPASIAGLKSGRARFSGRRGGREVVCGGLTDDALGIRLSRSGSPRLDA